jgi:Trk-type K+ transport system membrane component
MYAKVVVAIIGLISLFSAIIPFLFSVVPLIQNPSTENVQTVVTRGAETLVDIETPWWLPLLQSFAPLGIIVLMVMIFYPKLLNA